MFKLTSLLILCTLTTVLCIRTNEENLANEWRKLCLLDGTCLEKKNDVIRGRVGGFGKRNVVIGRLGRLIKIFKSNLSIIVLTSLT